MGEGRRLCYKGQCYNTGKGYSYNWGEGREKASHKLTNNIRVTTEGVSDRVTVSQDTSYKGWGWQESLLVMLQGWGGVVLGLVLRGGGSKSLTLDPLAGYIMCSGFITGYNCPVFTLSILEDSGIASVPHFFHGQFK